MQNWFFEFPFFYSFQYFTLFSNGISSLKAYLLNFKEVHVGIKAIMEYKIHKINFLSEF